MYPSLCVTGWEVWYIVGYSSSTFTPPVQLVQPAACRSPPNCCCCSNNSSKKIVLNWPGLKVMEFDENFSGVSLLGLPCLKTHTAPHKQSLLFKYSPSSQSNLNFPFCESLVTFPLCPNANLNPLLVLRAIKSQINHCRSYRFPLKIFKYSYLNVSITNLWDRLNEELNWIL